jgi:hypothetical protein
MRIVPGTDCAALRYETKAPFSRVIADYPNLTDCHLGVRRDRLPQKRLSDPSPNPSFVRVARDTDEGRPDAWERDFTGPISHQNPVLRQGEDEVDKFRLFSKKLMVCAGSILE